MKLEWSEHAVRDLQEIRTCWVARDPALIVDLTRDLRLAVEFLLETPKAGSLVLGTSRRKSRIGRTPFLLFCRVSGDVLRIGRIRHQNQNWLRLN
jgi:plasmid stabilization system protein ParE